MVLPDGLEFLKFGWWVVHAIAFLLVYQFGYARAGATCAASSANARSRAARPSGGGSLQMNDTPALPWRGSPTPLRR
jgi:hypothetical protein